MLDGQGGLYLRAGGLYLTSFGTDWLLDHLTVIKIQIHKYSNTQFGSNLQIDLTCAIFLKRSWYEDLKNNVSDCLTCNYTNTQIKFGLKVMHRRW